MRTPARRHPMLSGLAALIEQSDCFLLTQETQAAFRLSRHLDLGDLSEVAPSLGQSQEAAKHGEVTIDTGWRDRPPEPLGRLGQPLPGGFGNPSGGASAPAPA